MLPKVSIIIPFYNCAYVHQAISSALHQTYPNLEVIVVNDGSTVNMDKIKPFLRYIRYFSKENGGTASALNMGIQHASGSYITWLSSDDRYYPEKIAKQIDFMITRRADVCFSNYDLINPDGHIIRKSVTLTFRSAIEFYTRMLELNPINGCAVMLSKRLIDAVGCFDETLPYTHDYDMWLRIILTRADFYFLNESMLQYRIHDQMGTKRHWPKIQDEIYRTQANYRAPLMRLIEKLKKEAGMQ